MATAVASNPFFAKLHANRGMVFPFAVISLLMVILVPLPAAVLDFLLIVNMTLSVIVMVTVIYVQSPLEFSVFPSLLLATTMVRLVLNAATTRLILTAKGTDPQTALSAAGHVVETFAEFVTGGSLAVGVIIFVIIIVIQFVVITKGATRISEVAARFTLDAMPGKQMAIDADLNAGIIKEDEARRRREAIGQEADFYGAMDGASKFVRGDAVAAIIITIVNIMGGLYVGLVENGWPIMDCLRVYTKLTIGDGLVSQIPAFVVSLAAGLIVTRTSSRSNLGEEVIGQVLAKPKALIIAASFLLLMSFTSMPKPPLAVLGVCCAGMAITLTKNEKRQVEAGVKADREKTAAQPKEPEKVEKLLDLDTMELEVGYGLVRLVDTTKGGDLLERISMIRRQIATDLGILVPPIRIRDNMQLGANDYIVKIKGQKVGKGETFPEQYLAMDNGAVSGPIIGATQTTEPAFNLPAYWITEPQRPQAELLNYTVVEATAVLATHLTELVKSHAHELLTRQATKNLVEHIKLSVPALVEEVIPLLVKPGELQKVMQNLLRERVPVRDLETIIETVGDWAPRTKDMDVLSEYVRHALARTICKQYVDDQERIWCVTLDPALEDFINSHVERTERGTNNTMPPQAAQQIVQRVSTKTQELTQTGRAAVVLCNPTVRQPVRRMIETALPHVAVLSFNEVVPDVAVEAVAMVGMND